MKAKLHKQILAKLSKIVDKRTLQQLEIITIAIMSMTDLHWVRHYIFLCFYKKSGGG